MSLLPFGNLPPHRARRFVPEGLPLGDWEAVAPLFDRLDARASGCDTVELLERWLIDAGELSSALDEERARRYIAKTCHTDD
ncbi:MAG: M3 family oligoendopeptidase, partial [Verrucomicrobiota bacterium]